MKTKEISKFLEELLDEFKSFRDCQLHQNACMSIMRKKALLLQKTLSKKKTYEKKKK